MADITMCLGKNCKVKNNCYRFTGNPNKFYQSYSTFDKLEKNSEGKCIHFWEKVNPSSSEDKSIGSD